jgi:Glycosyl transferase family 2
MTRAAVVLLLYARPDTTQRLVDIVRAATPSRVLVVADGPRDAADAELCEATRDVIARAEWECDVLTNYAETNLGLKHRVESGLDWAFGLVDEAIVLEDDCLPHPTFFRFCDELLERYRGEPRVLSVSGDAFVPRHADASYRFSRYQHIWGWATWDRAWRLHDSELSRWPELRDSGWLETVLGDRHAVDYWTYLFEQTYTERHTWDHAWQLSAWLADGLSVVPQRNLVTNVGFRDDATNTRPEQRNAFADLPARAMEFPLRHPPRVERDADADRAVEDAMFGGNVRRLFARLRTRALVSVIVPTLNAERYLGQALESVRRQTYPRWEVVVVDGGSSDGTLDVAAGRDGVRIVQQTGVGLADAWNCGLANARGELIAFLDSDDLWEPEKLARQMRAFESDPAAECVITRMRFALEPGFEPPPGFRPELLDSDHVANMPSALLARGSVFERIGIFDTRWSIAPDIDWFARLKDANVRVVTVPEVLVRKRVHDANLSTLGGAKLNRELVAVLRESVERRREE